MSRVFVLAGLGNPGDRYAQTRHNVGFRVVDELARRWKVDVSRDRFQALFGQGKRGGGTVLLVKPQTFMNLSGESVAPLLRWHKAALSDLLVIYDDFALPLGKLRLRLNGSGGGHNGLESIIAHMGTEELPRLRLGVGPVPPGWNWPDFVLSKFAKDERETVDSMIARAADAVEVYLDEGPERAMGRFN